MVDDEADLLFTVRLALEVAGYRVLGASTGESALRLIEERDPDAIILDIRLPDIDGLEVLRRLREGGHASRVVVLSAHAGEAVQAQARALGCDVYLTKPFSPEELRRTIDKLLADS